MHPATQCWCGHALSAHADYRRITVGGCRASTTQHMICPCTLFRPEDEQIPIANLSHDLLKGLTVTIQTVLWQGHGIVNLIEHGNHRTLITLEEPPPALGYTTHACASDLPCTLTIEWSEP